MIARKTLVEFWSKPAHADAERSLRAWFKEVEQADWHAPSELKVAFRNASVLRDGRAVFNIHGNAYRLVVWINYAYQVVYIRFIGTHAEYDAIDAQTV